MPDAKANQSIETSEKKLRDAAVIAKSSGIECNPYAVDPDIKQMLEETLGSKSDPSDANLNFLKDDDATLTEVEKEMAAQLSFNYVVPKNFEEMKQLYDKMQKDGPAKPEDMMEGFSSAEDEEEENEDSPISPKARKSAQTEAERLIDRLISKPDDPLFNEGPPLHNIEETLSELDRQSGNPPEAEEDVKETVRRAKQKAQFDEWSQALKNKDIWGKE